jgi:hypothetical protein
MASAGVTVQGSDHAVQMLFPAAAIVVMAAGRNMRLAQAAIPVNLGEPSSAAF